MTWYASLRPGWLHTAMVSVSSVMPVWVSHLITQTLLLWISFPLLQTSPSVLTPPQWLMMSDMCSRKTRVAIGAVSLLLVISHPTKSVTSYHHQITSQSHRPSSHHSKGLTRIRNMSPLSLLPMVNHQPLLARRISCIQSQPLCQVCQTQLLILFEFDDCGQRFGSKQYLCGECPSGLRFFEYCGSFHWECQEPFRCGAR